MSNQQKIVKHNHISIKENYQYTSIPLNRQLLQYYISSEKFKTFNPPNIANISKNWRSKKPKFFALNDEEIIVKSKITVLPLLYEKKFTNIEILQNDEQVNYDENNVNFSSENQHIILNSKENEELKQIYINSLNLQLIHYICSKLTNFNNNVNSLNTSNTKSLINILIKDLLINGKFTFNENIDETTKIIGIPNIFSTLPFLINRNIDKIKTISNYEAIQEFIVNGYKTGYFIDNSKYLKSLLKLYEVGSDEYKFMEEIINKYETDDNLENKEAILQKPCSSLHYIFYIIKKENETYKPYKFTFRELNSEDKNLLEKIEELSKQIYTKIYRGEPVLYNNYYSYVEYNDIFCVNVKLNYPYDNDKIFYYLNTTSIQLTELIQSLEYIGNVKINIDLNLSYLENNYKKFDFTDIQIINPEINKKSKKPAKQQVFFNNNIQIIIFNSSKWGQYEIIYTLNNEYYYLNFKTLINENISYYEILEGLNGDDAINKIKGFTENLPLYKFNMKQTNILSDFKNKYYVYIINFYIKYYLRHKETFNSKKFNNFNINNNLEIGQLKSNITLNVQPFDFIKVESGNIIIFIQKNKSSGINERILVWILKKELIEYLEKQQKKNVNTINNILNKLLTHPQEEKLNDLFDLKYTDLINIRSALEKAGITNNEYFIYFNIFNKLVTMTPHIHILKKPKSLYYNPRFGLDMYLMDYQKSYSLGKAINFLESNPNHINLLKENLNIMQIDNMDLTFLPLQQLEIRGGIGNLSNNNYNSKKLKKTKKKNKKYKIKNKFSKNIKKTKKETKRQITKKTFLSLLNH